MNNRSLQDPSGILWLGSISIGIVLCMVIVWLFLLRESSIGKMDQALRHDVQVIGVLYKYFTVHTPPPQMAMDEILDQIFLNPWKFRIEIYDTRSKYYYTAGSSDTSISLYKTGFTSLEQPITETFEKNISYRIYRQSFDGFVVYAASPVPTLWSLLTESYLNLAIVLPLLTAALATIGIWSFVRLHRPIQRLDGYLQSLLQQPLEKDMLKPPQPPKGDIYHLTQTVSKIVERLHASRNQALQFSSFATHELRTPLSIIRNQLESALASQTRAKELRGVVASAYDEMLRLNRAVEDLLSLGTMQAGTLTLNPESISLPKFLNSFYDEALFLTRPKNISVVLKKGPEVYIKGDIIKLRQVFFNLLDNAIKYTPSGKRIRLNYTLKDNNVIIVFTDTGIGIAPDKLERIFEPFFTYAQKNGSNRGTGLGLALIKWIIELHQGSITVSSQIDVGTEFTISLPYEKVIE